MSAGAPNTRDPWQNLGLVLAALVAMALPAIAETGQENVDRVEVTFSGGHETEKVDHGRPVTLIAGALEVPPKVFREAFSHVRPAPGGHHPDPEQVRRNKEALMSRLGQYGVTNQRLDEVSNQYRYRPQEGELWPVKAAKAYALVDRASGKVTGFVVESGGYGYNSPPKATVPGHPGLHPMVTLQFGPKFDENGSVAEISLESPSPKP